MGLIHDKLGSSSLKERMRWSLAIFFTLFFLTVLISYYALPDGILKGRNPLHRWNTSGSIVISTLQIFGFNMISVLVIIFAGLFGQKKREQEQYLSVGYMAFFSLIFINAVVLGTWSFTSGGNPVPLILRFVRTFDLIHRAGLWEMLGQLLITCATAHISIVLTNGRETETKQIKSVYLSKAEQGVFALGIALMMTGAIVESIAIQKGW